MTTEEHLKIALDYLEGRIKLLDNKANILIAVETLIFAIIALFIDKLFKSAIPPILYIFLCLFAIYYLVIIGYLFHVIRPTLNYLDFKKNKQGIFPLNKRIESINIIWPSTQTKPEKNGKKGFLERVKNCKEEDSKTDLMSSVFSLHWLIYRKYKQYKCTMTLLKIQPIVMSVLFGVLIILKIFGKT